MVHAYAHGRVVLAADVEEGHQLGLYLFQLGGVLLVGVLQVLEYASRIDIVAWVYAHLLAVLCGHVGRVCREVYVGHQWLPVAVGFQSGGYVAHVLRLARALRGEAHQLAACVYDTLGLGHRGLGVVGVGGGHRLYSYRVVATYPDVSDACLC